MQGGCRLVCNRCSHLAKKTSLSIFIYVVPNPSLVGDTVPSNPTTEYPSQVSASGLYGSKSTVWAWRITLSRSLTRLTRSPWRQNASESSTSTRHPAHSPTAVQCKAVSVSSIWTRSPSFRRYLTSGDQSPHRQRGSPAKVSPFRSPTHVTLR
jgi:hypothetical protein